MALALGEVLPCVLDLLLFVPTSCIPCGTLSRVVTLAGSWQPNHVEVKLSTCSFHGAAPVRHVVAVRQVARACTRVQAAGRVNRPPTRLGRQQL